MMKILYVVVSLSPEWGGPTKAVTELTEALAKRGLEISIFAPVRKGDDAKIIRPKGVKLQLFEQGLFARWWSGYSPKLAKAVAQETSKFDLVHIHELWSHPHLSAYRAAKKAKKPYVISVHGGLEPWAINHKALKKKVYSVLCQRRILQKAGALHAITDEETKHIRAFGVDNEILMIPNGINPEEFQNLPSRWELEQLYPRLAGKLVVLFLGRLHPIKGLDILARAFGKIARGRDDLCLLVVGPDSAGYQAEVVKILETDGVLDKVVFAGMLSGHEKLAALGGADVCVIPSYSEVRSIVALEAMASGLPVIITRQCHFPEAADAKAGLVIEPEVNQLAAALEKLLNEPTLRQEMGSNGRRLVAEKFTWDKVADQMIKMYEEVLDKGSRRTKREEKVR
jgi:glycosyltransferase involved in cell wall biosynthesis